MLPPPHHRAAPGLPGPFWVPHQRRTYVRIVIPGPAGILIIVRIPYRLLRVGSWAVVNIAWYLICTIFFILKPLILGLLVLRFLQLLANKPQILYRAVSDAQDSHCSDLASALEDEDYLDLLLCVPYCIVDILGILRRLLVALCR